jgi:hypothetical protein
MSNNKQNRGLLQRAKEGFGLGIGVSLAQRAVSAVFGPPTMAVTTPKSASRELTEYEQCLIENSDIGLCAHLLKKD